MIAALVIVELLGCAVPLALWEPVSGADLKLTLLLASLSVTYSVFVVGWEIARRHLYFERTSLITPNLLATWCFAAVIMLPPTLAALVTAAACAGGWKVYNAAGERRTFRYVYSAMSSVVAAAVASAVFHHNLPVGWAILAAAGCWIGITAATILLGMCASGQFDGIKEILHPGTYRLEVITMALAVGLYVGSHFGLPIVWLSLPAAVLILRADTQHQLQGREVGGRPMDQSAWLHIGRVLVDACAEVTVIRIDSADPIAARVVAMMQAGCDAIGKYGPNGLAILLPDCPAISGEAIARRIRIALECQHVEGTAVSASSPRAGRTLEGLLAVCEAELVVARESSSRPVGPS